MKLRYAAWHLLAVVAAVVILFLRLPTVLQHGAWSGGRSTVLGKIESVASGGKYKNVKVVEYSYEVDGNRYTGSDSGIDTFSGMPRTVTYAVSDPSVSTLTPDSIDGKYRTSLILCIFAVAPMLGLWIAELRAHSREIPATSDHTEEGTASSGP